jgi:F-type H+-transporting ATPase subunit epsilon
MKSFNLKIVTPDGLFFDSEVESLLVRTDDGDVELLAGHIDYMASLGTGRARIKQGGKDRYASVSGGFVTVKGGEVNLVAVTFEFRENIDLERAKAARDQAKSTISSTSDDKVLKIAKAKLQRALNRIDVAEM